MDLKIDKLDRQILHLLMQNVNRAYTDIAKELGVSGGTIHVRLKKMTEMGIVQGAQLLINPAAIGYDICAFIGVFLEKGSAYKEVVEKMRVIPEIVELHYTTGSYSMFVKIICRDTKHLREVLNEKMQGIAGVHRTETFISLEESISRQISVGVE
ncbi:MULTISPECIES: Lrp/AsnC ligand binding domain-containing protein [Pontibacter]|uniref:Lrp/AsnC family transcriptional regulator, regulator for asnA, asnC and gidA n=1 Tax=Pontibacter lucknowensis TaxID=1077936 RepID=A0A1N6V501_9BACT|nr:MULTISPECIES: Lrp/AsnC ligand binding domain-containing protein [Pontibacter]EJF09063.1 AsnC family transcriptional regulator [Pontibacter sp. BAB1700]SIQ72656.1 Lrp/AsnC family transcriptional regulator, regulator for asnA, asnC and gidA [Pontibacter lucknowensis]